MSRKGPAPPTSVHPRRQLTAAVVGGAVGAGLVLLGAAQTWAVKVTPRQAPLSPLREEFTGTGLLPWAPALALVALAGSVALVATAGWGRRLVASLVAACGGALTVAGALGIAVAGAQGRQTVDAGLWPAVCLIGGLLVAGTGLHACRRGAAWPRLGARYERPSGRRSTDADPARLWDELEAGTDPTDGR